MPQASSTALPAFICRHCRSDNRGSSGLALLHLAIYVTIHMALHVAIRVITGMLAAGAPRATDVPLTLLGLLAERQGLSEL